MWTKINYKLLLDCLYSLHNILFHAVKVSRVAESAIYAVEPDNKVNLFLTHHEPICFPALDLIS